MAQQTTPRPASPDARQRSVAQPIEPTPDGDQLRASDDARATAPERDYSDVPERPALAPDIGPIGEMAESGFAEPQWLVQREGQYIHLTELLYHVLEQIDGQRTLEEIAERMSERIDRHVTADNVRQLIGTKLIPLGIVLQADGTVADRGEEKRGISPLQINMKTKVLPRGLITPLTNVLKFLYFPPLLIVILLACLVSQVWLFVFHGIAASFHEAVYNPLLTLVLLGIIVVGTVWHEFGHAAALEYGGGEVRGMGAGFYLVYPAFYTDVTDNYRLGRWARVRTDLGGFYFNLIFCLGLVGLYFLTHQAFLLLGVFVIDLDILHQCLPFVRLDGYWTLADLTGIPDLFSYIGPFIRTHLHIKQREGGRKLPELKTWVKVIFALYILVTIPVLAFLLFVMLKNVPRILASAWDSFSKQGSALASAWSGGHYGEVALAAIQMLILTLPVAGLLYTLYSLGRKAMTLLWTWSKPTPGRRVIGSFATAACIALLVLLWFPSLPFPRGGKSSAIAAQDNWQPVSSDERGTISDALPQATSAPVRPSPTGIPATSSPVTTAATGTATSAVAATSSPVASATPDTTETPVGTPVAGATAIPTVMPTLASKPTSAPVVATAGPQSTQAPILTPTAPRAANTTPANTPAPPGTSAANASVVVPVTAPAGTPAATPTP